MGNNEIGPFDGQPMSAPKVYFTDMRCKVDESILDKMKRVVCAAGIRDIEMNKRFVAIKMHFGELGNLSFLRPNYAKVVADIVKEEGGIPYLTDCNTMYPGSRKNAVEHMDCANLNGFVTATTGCQIIIGDGLRGTDDVEVPINGTYVEKAKIGRAIADCDVLITLSHFKGHEITGFGGAIKNLAMGCASRRGKMEMHSQGKPRLDASKCVGCGKCAKSCGQDAISIVGGKAKVDADACVGCGRCIGMCAFDAIYAEYDQDGSIVDMKMVEYAAAVIKDRPSFHISVICDVSPYCDCHSGNDAPIIPDVGILASADPVALDKACVDLVLKQPVIPGSHLHDLCGKERPEDLLQCSQPGTRWQAHFEHSERMGLGNGGYELVKVD